jgi:hypothetical protein
MLLYNWQKPKRQTVDPSRLLKIKEPKWFRGKTRQANIGIGDIEPMQARIWIWAYKTCTEEALKKALAMFFPAHLSLSYSIY